MQTLFTITQIIDDDKKQYIPKQNPVACLVGVAVDLFKQPYYLVEVNGNTANIGSINALNLFLSQFPDFSKITVKDAISPLGDENHLILKRIDRIN
ncbi:MAG: hypothetical protein JXR47_05285 [Thiotrichales bacterium]|nr:hypothetical protein [Thiotrichales bacterium]